MLYKACPVIDFLTFINRKLTKLKSALRNKQEVIKMPFQKRENFISIVFTLIHFPIAFYHFLSNENPKNRLLANGNPTILVQFIFSSISNC
jgi:hypothetical protein